MQKQNPIDDLFRRGLAGYRVKPSDERKEEFIREAAGTEVKRPRAGWWLIAGAVLILAGAGIALLLTHGSESSIPPTLRNDRDAGIPPAVTEVTNSTNGTASPQLTTTLHVYQKGVAILNRSKTVTSVTSGEKTPSTMNESRNEIVKPSSEIAASPTSSPAGEKPAADLHRTETASVPPAEPSAVIRVNERPNAPLAKTDEKPNAPLAKTDEKHLNPENPGEQKVPSYKGSSNVPGKWNISTGVYYTPEWMFNTLNGDKYVNNMGVEATLHFGNYSVRTGIGLSITNGWHEVLVQSNPYLGSYKALDSIVFTWNKSGTQLNPTYYTTGTNVYDTTREYNYSYVQKRYTYMQIPLVLGYDFFKNDWLSLGVRAGAVMSLLLNTENLTTTYDAGKDRIVSINNVTPDRIQLNWQAMAGFNAAFRLSRRFGIELEPEMRYYFNSVYESSDITTKPWSIGVRAAFIVVF